MSARWLLGARDTFPNFQPVHNCLPSLITAPTLYLLSLVNVECSRLQNSLSTPFYILSLRFSIPDLLRWHRRYCAADSIFLHSLVSCHPRLAHASYRFRVPLAIWTSSNRSFSTLLNPSLQRPDFRSVFLLSLTGSAYFTLLTDRNHFYVSRYVRRVIKPSERSPRRSPLSLLPSNLKKSST